MTAVPLGRKVYVTTATGALGTDAAPVGGGVAVLEALLPHLGADPELDATVLRPGRRDRESVQGGVRLVDLALPSLAGTPDDHLLHLSERAYARFALEWERRLQRFFETVPAAGSLVLANDVSEGPPFAELARRGFAQAVLYHVVVGDFFARQYLSTPLGSVPAALASRVWRGVASLGLDRAAPAIARLVWAKEAAAAEHAHALVPSADLARALRELYPESGVGGRTTICPWGVVGEPDPALRAGRAEVLAELGMAESRFVLLALSRLSREKRIELLLDALARVEREAPETAARLALCVAGAPAYMGGHAYAARLRRRAERLQHVQVVFPGYVPAPRKWSLFAAADLFCSTSAYEAYGLTIAQALASGTPALATDHQGARAILDPRLGWIVAPTPGALARAIGEALDGVSKREAAARWGAQHPFAEAAASVLAVLRTVTA